MFLGMHIGIHDTNISLYKDGKCYYAKYERHSGIKHGVGSLQWIKDTLKKWGVDSPETQIKHFVSCDSFYEDPSHTQGDTIYVGGSPTTKYAMHNIFSDDLLGPLLINNYNIIREMKSQWQAQYDSIAHHILHTYSTLRPYRQAVVDGKGTGNRYALLMIRY